MRKARDYRAEEARRNAIAVSLGYKNRHAMRRAIELGKIAPRRPQTVRSPITVAAQKFRQTSERQGYLLETPASVKRTVDGLSPRRRAEDWSDVFGKTAMASVDATDDDNDPTGTKRDFIRKHGKTRYTEAYLAAFVEGPQRYKVSRKGGSAALFFWFVVVTQTYSVEEYEIRYSGGEV